MSCSVVGGDIARVGAALVMALGAELGASDMVDVVFRVVVVCVVVIENSIASLTTVGCVRNLRVL
jgi:hypothetical protein